MSTFNQHFYSGTFCGSILNPETCRMVISKHQKENFICTLYKASSQCCKQTTRHSIWARQHIHCHWRALREVNWKLIVQVISILNDFLLGMHGPRYCTNLVCSIYLPIMFHLPTSLPLYQVCHWQSNIFNYFNFVWFHFNRRFFLCWKINKIAPPKEFSYLLVYRGIPDFWTEARHNKTCIGSDAEV